MEFFLSKRSTVLKKKNLFGRRSGASPLFLVAFPVQAPESILFNNDFQFEIIRQFSDQEGRYLIIDMKIDNILSRAKKHHFSKFAIFRRLNRAHQELSFKTNSRKKWFFCADLWSANVFLC